MWEGLSLEDWSGVAIGLLFIWGGLSGGPVYPLHGVNLFQQPLEVDGAKVVRALFVVAGVVVTAVSLYLAL
jgi:hypothetical protein